MSQAIIAMLADRGVVSVTGPDARAFLDNLVTNDMDLLETQEAIHAALLSPQGKILFAFFIVRTPAGFLLETGLDQTAALAKRLSMYKLRAKVEIKDAAGEVVVVVSQGDVRARPQGAITFVDPRSERLGDRVLLPAPMVGELLGRMGAERMLPQAYHGQRIGLGVPEAGLDYALGDTFPHEANFDRFNGVSFTKGCFVGQEVVARMQHKTVVRKRIVRVTGAGTLRSGADIAIGDVVIGRVGSVSGRGALAMLRLDRVAEAADKGQTLTSEGTAITVEDEAMERYRASVAEREALGA
ncbi:MAG: folate-binding protein [Hyphomicrobiaceae bacterium]